MEEHIERTDPIQAEDVVTQPVPVKSSLTEFFTETVKTILLALLLYFAISAVTDRVRVENVSMQPTLFEGELLVVWKPAYRFGEPHRGDIIVFHHNRQPPEDYIKRVIGLPGDEVLVENEQVSINGTFIDEPYIAMPPAYNGSWSVPPDSLFVLGDNRNRSSDSHVWGFVPMSAVVGRAVLIYWPPDSIRILSHTDLLDGRR
jgi:signal peptidase I